MAYYNQRRYLQAQVLVLRPFKSTFSQVLDLVLGCLALVLILVSANLVLVLSTGLGSKLENKKMQPFMFVAVIISYSIFTVYCSLWTKYNRPVVKYFHAMLD